MLGTFFGGTVGTCSRSSWVKTEQNCLFKISAFRWFSDTNNPSDLRVEIPLESFLSFFTKDQNCFLLSRQKFLMQGSKYFFWLQGLFWTKSTKSSPLVYILPLTNIFQRGYFVKFGGKLPLAPLYFEPCSNVPSVGESG